MAFIQSVVSLNKTKTNLQEQEGIHPAADLGLELQLFTVSSRLAYPIGFWTHQASTIVKANFLKSLSLYTHTHSLLVLSLWRTLTNTIQLLPSINSPSKITAIRKLVSQPRAISYQKVGPRQFHSSLSLASLSLTWGMTHYSHLDWLPNGRDRVNDIPTVPVLSTIFSTLTASHLFLKIRCCREFLYTRSQCGKK